MAKLTGQRQVWQSVVDGYQFEFSHTIENRKHVLSVNGTPIEFKTSLMSSLLGFDEGFQLQGREARLVIDRNGPDVAIDGFYLRSGKKYVARPAWVLVFAVLCILLPIVNLGGFIPVVLGLVGMGACVALSRKDMKTVPKVLLCVAITLAAWGAWLLFAVLLNLFL